MPLNGAGFKAFLAALREIGWAEWDPIGLANERVHCEDEYESYLLAAARKFSNGASEDKVADYLEYIASHHMGLGDSSPLTRVHALTTARRIAALVRQQA